MWYSRMCLLESLITKFLLILSICLPRQDDFSPQNAAVSSRVLENDPYDTMDISNLAEPAGASSIKIFTAPA